MSLFFHHTSFPESRDIHIVDGLKNTFPDYIENGIVGKIVSLMQLAPFFGLLFKTTT